MKAIVSLVDGLPLKDSDAQIELIFDESSLVIVEKGFERFKSVAAAKFKLPLENIVATLMTTEKEFLEKDKSAIGRGVVGGLLFGPAGLVLGGLSGIGKKKTSRSQHLYIVSYISAASEMKNITFTMPALMSGVTKKFDAKLNKKMDEIKPSPKVYEYRNYEVQKEFQL